MGTCAALLGPGYVLATGADAADPGLLAFLSLRGSARFDSDRPVAHPAHGAAGADLLYAHAHGGLRLLAEGYVTDDEAGIDRLQLGWELRPETIVWLGKLHAPSSAWNFGQDHGHYLQTAITTPSIEKWAEYAGVLPQAISGLLLDTRRPIGDSAAVQLTVALGIAPNPVGNPDESYWVRPLSAGVHRLAWSARVALLPDFAGTGSLGLLAGRYRLDARDLGSNSFRFSLVDQSVYGIYAEGDWASWSLRSTLYYVDLSLRQQASYPRSEGFSAAYIQLERRLDDRVTLFARHENSSRASESAYLRAVQGGFALRRSLIGARWDFLQHQAMTLELARSGTVNNSGNIVGLQWSAVVP